ASPYSQHYKALQKINELIETRKQQKAFHPSATQFTLQLGEQIFGFWRQSIDRRQSIFCISNVSDQLQNIRLSDINLIGSDKWLDLLSQKEINADDLTIDIYPYQTMWISNIRQ
ncbi:MAG: sucrose phosphorylase, partial [Paraglaciecola sp.]